MHEIKNVVVVAIGRVLVLPEVVDAIENPKLSVMRHASAAALDHEIVARVPLATDVGFAMILATGFGACGTVGRIVPPDDGVDAGGFWFC